MSIVSTPIYSSTPSLAEVNSIQTIFQEVYIAVVTVIAVIGNGVVLSMCVLNNKLLNIGSTVLVFILCCTHFILCVGNMFWISLSLMTGSWLGGSQGVWCEVSAALPTYMVHIAYLLFALISMDCSFAICHPFRYKIYITLKKILIAVVLCFILPIPINTVITMDLDVMYNRHLGQCQLLWNPYSFKHKLYILVMFVCFAIVPMICMLVSYMLIFRAVTSRQLIIYPSYKTRQCNVRAKRRRNIDVNYNIAKMALMMITCFIVTWLPNFILSFFIMFFPDKAMEVVRTWIIDLSVWMYYFSPAITPIIYTLRNQSLRHNVKRYIMAPIFRGVSTIKATAMTPERLTSTCRLSTTSGGADRAQSLRDRYLFLSRQEHIRRFSDIYNKDRSQFIPGVLK